MENPSKIINIYPILTYVGEVKNIDFLHIISKPRVYKNKNKKSVSFK